MLSICTGPCILGIFIYLSSFFFKWKMPWNLRRVLNVMHSFFAHQTDTLFLSIEKHKSFYLKSLSMKIVEEDCSDMTPPLLNWSKVRKAILVKIFLFHSRYLISSHLCGHMFFDSKVGLTRHSKHRVKTGYMIGIHKNHFTRQWRLLSAHFITRNSL